MPPTIRCRDGCIEIEPAAQPVTRMKKGRVAVALAANVAPLSAATVRRTQQSVRDRRRSIEDRDTGRKALNEA